MLNRFYAFIVLSFAINPIWENEEPTVLITGANRDIGLELARIYADRNWNVIATARNPEAAKDLEIIQSDHLNLHDFKALPLQATILPATMPPCI